MDQQGDSDGLPGVATLELLTGPQRGKVTWLSSDTIEISDAGAHSIRVRDARAGEPAPHVLARLHRSEDTYEIEALEDRPIWVNRERITSRRLEHCDMIEFGEKGPMSRFRLYPEERVPRWTVHDILSDAVAYLRSSRRPVVDRTFRAVLDVLRRLAGETTILFRLTVLAAIVFLGVLAYQQNQLNALLQQRVESEAERLESFAGALARARDEALTPGDLQALREELGQELTSASERLEALELRSQASARVVAQSMPSVVFLQGAYGFRETETGRMLRQVVDADGKPAISPRGRPLLSLDGEGPVAERQFTGTGFAIGDDGAMITNRHVALPWEDDATATALSGQGMEPVMIRFIAYRPEQMRGDAVTLLRASDEADLAVLSPAEGALPVSGLDLSEAPPALGDEVIVMGYPTGLRSMLAQAGEAFVTTLQEKEDTDFWSVAARLAEAGHIAPLASRGIVGQVSKDILVYDAETTHGGSGGPVLNMNGSVVAVNMAILPEFGGSNMGVPAAKVRALLDQAAAN